MNRWEGPTNSSRLWNAAVSCAPPNVCGVVLPCQPPDRPSGRAPAGPALPHHSPRVADRSRSYLFARCQRLIEERDDAFLAISDLHSAPTGLLRMTAAVAYGALHRAAGE